MVEVFQRKNYYFLQTMLGEIEKYDVISFNIFDTLILRNVLFPRDVWRLASKVAEEKYGIMDFHCIRENVENDIRASHVHKPVRLKEVYEEIKRRYPQWPVEELQNMEIHMERTYCIANPLIHQIFVAARAAQKKLYLISDTILPVQEVEQILNQCDCTNYTKLYLASECDLHKHTGELFQHILDNEGVDPRNWLHIGNDFRCDQEVPRQLHITAAAYVCPRDFYFRDLADEHARKEEATGVTIPQEPLDTSLTFSVETAKSLNASYTQVQEPLEEEVVSVENVSMMFNMCAEKVDSIKEYVIRLLKRQLQFNEFWALKNVSFSVRRGEKLGLIGLNGSGKSTMLKIVSGVMKATKGTVKVSGSIAPLIELGAGFDAELSAKENIFLNGAILGYSRQEMQDRYDEIIEFAELKEFENVAIKNFSSGMIARLGFAIATCHVPDILIIDEILSVGDFAFQRKCHRKMRELTECGTTVLFVSHSGGDIINMCDRAVWLDHGNLIQQGQAQYIVEKYMNQ